MREIVALALKDMRLLVRDRGSLFFTVVWPLLIAILFGAIFSGGSDTGRMRIAVADEDGTAASREFVQRLSKTEGIEVAPVSRAVAADLVRRGRRQAYVVLGKGFGERSGRMFYGQAPEVELGIDPSRKAESAMLEGFLMRHAVEQMQKTLDDPARSTAMAEEALNELRRSADRSPAREQTERFLGELKAFLGSGAAGTPPGSGEPQRGMAWQPLTVKSQPIQQQRSGPANAFAVSLPQGAVWGLVGCAAAFAIGLVVERTRGTLMRLQTAPLSRLHVLAGKALACFLTAAGVQALVFAVGAVVFKVRPGSVMLLVVAVVCSCAAFVGIMMLLSVLGRSEQAVSGSAWAALLVMSMIGGGMVPLFAMPRWMAAMSDLSPVKWAIVALEGAIWRGFSPMEMLLPCGILLAVGAAAFAIGAKAFRMM